MIQILLQNLKMDPLVSLHYYAPVCAIITASFIPFTEGLAPFYAVKEVGAAVLLSNALVAFLLNVAAVFLVSVGSGLILTLAGVFKVRSTFSSIPVSMHGVMRAREASSYVIIGVAITPTLLNHCAFCILIAAFKWPLPRLSSLTLFRPISSYFG